MTREEIVAMTPEQLRIAITKTKGGQVIRANVSTVRDGKVIAANVNWFDCPDWPTDISAALELVEEMNGDGLWQLSNGDGDSIDFRFTHFSTVDKDGFLTVKENIFSSSDTAPLAIARAWLMWKATA